jgi:NAD(P)H-quinone oxidoreductase subunit 5
VAGTFHLYTHAFFKALLFLTAGSVIHGVGTQDLREMGGLRRYMPITFLAMGFAGASLAGIPPFSGFWSKDEVLNATFNSGNMLLFLFAMITVFLTAFYMFRAWFMAFFGEFRGGRQGTSIDLHASDAARAGHDAHAVAADPHAAVADSAAHGHGHGTPHESPPVMTIPMLILLIPTILSGFWILLGPSSFSAFIEGHDEGFHFDPLVGGLSIGLAVLGIVLAYLTYAARSMRPVSVPGLYPLLLNRYYVDEIYAAILAAVVLRGSQVVAAFDSAVIDGIVNGVGRLSLGAGNTVRSVQTGRVQGYAMVVFGGLLIILVFTALLPLLGVGSR